MEFLVLLVIVLALVGVVAVVRRQPDSLTLGWRQVWFGLLPSALRLGPDEQSFHAAIFGRTGAGKSFLLQTVFVNHLRLGHGVGILEPHHDLSIGTLSYLVQHGFFRQDDAYERVLYLDWGNGAYVPFNVLAGQGSPHTKALNALDAMLRVWPELQQAPLFQTLFLSSVMVLIENQLPLTFLHRLLSEHRFREMCLRRMSSDDLVRQVFAEFDRLGKDQPQAAGSTLRRAFLLSFSPLARYTLGQPDNVLDFRRIVDDGRSIIINLGNVGDPETKKLLGALLMVQLEQAALSRSDLPPAQRTPFTLLVDEWPAFCAQEQTLADLLSQVRKFNLRLWLAAQSLAQVDSARLVGALENCKLQIAFGLGRDSAVTQSRHLATVDVKTQRAAEQFEQWAQELQNLGPRFAYVKLEGKPAVKIKTLDVPDGSVDPDELAEVLATYRGRYQRTMEEAEQAMAAIVLPGASNGVTPAAELDAAAPAAPRTTKTRRVSKLPKT